jgi:hypothetical protein
MYYDPKNIQDLLCDQYLCEFWSNPWRALSLRRDAMAHGRPPTGEIRPRRQGERGTAYRRRPNIA